MNMYEILILLLISVNIHGFISPSLVQRRFQHQIYVNPENRLGGNAASRGLFAITEIFGQLIGGSDEKRSSTRSRPRRLSTLDMSKIIRSEYENIFWITGNMNMDLWEDNCVFADPFSSFGGEGSTLRFKRNADALGSLVLNPTIKITECTTTTDPAGDIVKVGWIFSSTLKLPWRPVLAAAGVTSHYLSAQSGKIVRYEESWRSNPWDVVKRLFVPSRSS